MKINGSGRKERRYPSLEILKFRLRLHRTREWLKQYGRMPLSASPSLEHLPTFPSMHFFSSKELLSIYPVFGFEFMF